MLPSFRSVGKDQKQALGEGGPISKEYRTLYALCYKNKKHLKSEFNIRVNTMPKDLSVFGSVNMDSQ